MFPYLGRDLLIRTLQTGDKLRIEGDVVYLPAELSDKEMRAATLELLSDKAYPLIFPKLQHWTYVGQLALHVAGGI
jgi:hypothetical protein